MRVGNGDEQAVECLIIKILELADIDLPFDDDIRNSLKCVNQEVLKFCHFLVLATNTSYSTTCVSSGLLALITEHTHALSSFVLL
jgi:hypothetical protein